MSFSGRFANLILCNLRYNSPLLTRNIVCHGIGSRVTIVSCTKLETKFLAKRQDQVYREEIWELNSAHHTFVREEAEVFVDELDVEGKVCGEDCDNEEDIYKDYEAFNVPRDAESYSAHADFKSNDGGIDLLKVLPRTTANDLKHWLFTTSYEAERILHRYPRIAKQSAKRTRFMISLWEGVGITNEVIKAYPWMVLRSSDFVAHRRKQIRFYQAKEGVEMEFLPTWVKGPLIGAFPFKRVESFLSAFVAGELDVVSFLHEFEERVEYFSHKLQVDKYTVIQMGLKHSHLFTVPFLKLSSIMQLLQGSAGFTNEDISNDLWVFKHNYEVALDRINSLKEKGINLKTWMLRAPEKTLSNTLRRHESIKAVLGGRTQMQFLQERLNCEVGDVLQMLEKSPTLVAVHPAKLEQHIDFLLNQGFTDRQIIKSPRIFVNSFKTISKRVQQLKEWRRPLETKYLYLSKRQYYNVFKEHLKAKNKPCS